jgi:nitroreductase
MTTADGPGPPPALDFIYRRHAVRAFRPERLDEKTIRTLLAAAVQAPTAMHLEPWAFAIVQDRATLKRYSDHAKAMLLDATHHDLVRPSDASSTRGARSLLADPAFNIFYDAGTLIVICARPLGNFVTADCWLAAENLMLAAAALGLGTCCIGFAVPVMNTAEVKRELGIGADVTAVAPIIVGVPATAPVPPPRKTPEVLSWIR